MPPSGVTRSPTARLRALGGWVATRGMGMALGWAGLGSVPATDVAALEISDDGTGCL